MKQKRILSVQDFSCFGTCSNTVALPVLSAAGIECAVLPTALLSTHTGGFTGYSFLDLTEEMGKILRHWAQEPEIRFDMLYTGYFGSAPQLELLASFRDTLLLPGGSVVIDPVLGDRGQLYSIYDNAYVNAMRNFCRMADLITPNVTEACLLAGLPYEGDFFTEARFHALLERLLALGCGAAVITGVRFDDDRIGVAYRTQTESLRTVSATRSPAPLHGTGDLFASALAGYILNGCALPDALKKTILFVSACIRDTEEDLRANWYGVRFERRLGMLSADAEALRQRENLL